MGFTNKFKEKTRNSNLRCHLAVAFDVSYFTIVKWLDEKDNDELTKPKYLEKLVEITGLSEKEIFE